MDSNIVGLIVGLGTTIGIMAIAIGALVKWFTAEKPKPVNGNGVKQSQDCWKQHEAVLSAIAEIKGELKILSIGQSAIQKTLDDRQVIFSKIQERIDDVNLSVLRGWDGADRRKS